LKKIKNISVSTTEALSVPLAVSSIRESDSIIRATNGQVVVIGGLMQDVLQDDNASVPGLGDVPVVGGLFGHTQQVKTKSDLVILLKPIVVNGSRQWSDTLRQTRERISGFKSK
jgi:MSHA biogenesis protein MshL